VTCEAGDLEDPSAGKDCSCLPCLLSAVRTVEMAAKVVTRVPLEIQTLLFLMHDVVVGFDILGGEEFDSV
jgi:hypothetical protein